MNFTVSKDEQSRAEHWAVYHGRKVRGCGEELELRERARLQWQFISTGVGTVVSVMCLRCYQTYDVSEYDSW